MDTAQIISRLDNLHDVNNGEQLQRMVDAVSYQADSPRPAVTPAVTEALFHVFERFPDDDGYETFWFILHVLEATPDYVPALVASINRQPSYMTFLMLNRVIFSDRMTNHNIEPVKLLQCFLEDASHCPVSPEWVKENIEECKKRSG